MPPPPPNGLFFSIDLVSSLIIAVICFGIYILTREFYALTKHEGIAYFRYAFLFFGISFLAQVLFPLLHFLAWRPPPILLGISIYAGSVAVLALLYSVLWKKLKLRHPMLFIQITAIVLASTVFLGRFFRHFFVHPLFIIQGILFAIAIAVSYRDARKKPGHALGLHVTYALLFASWVANGIANIAMRESAVLAVALNLLSLLLFLILLVRVYRKTRVP